MIERADEKRESGAAMHTWLTGPMEPAARAILERARLAEDVLHIAVMPDVHPANDICVGAVMATRRLVYPAAVGGDIGCGMLAVAFDSDADLLQNPAHAGALLRQLREHIPTHRRHRARTIPFVESSSLSHPALAGVMNDAGKLQVGTLGGGNHFVEFQADEQDRLWLMLHSGSRAMGQAIKSHHVARAAIRSGSMMALDTANDGGQSYLHDQQWARDYANANRQAMGSAVEQIVRELFKIEPIESMTICCDHNHVAIEQHFGQSMLVHRKGAMPAGLGQAGVVPGSMGTQSYHVIGKGCEMALRSSAHGAGRLLSRQAARERFDRRDIQRQMQAVWFDPKLADALREESPKSYKDIRKVMSAQAELVEVRRTLKPLLVFKGK